MSATRTLAVLCPVVTEASIAGPTEAATDTAVTLERSFTSTDIITGGAVVGCDNGVVGTTSVYSWMEAGTVTVACAATGACGEPVMAIHRLTVGASDPSRVRLVGLRAVGPGV